MNTDNNNSFPIDNFHNDENNKMTSHYLDMQEIYEVNQLIKVNKIETSLSGEQLIEAFNIIHEKLITMTINCDLPGDMNELNLIDLLKTKEEEN